jgi:hypothetical protein
MARLQLSHWLRGPGSCEEDNESNHVSSHEAAVMDPIWSGSKTSFQRLK